MKRARALSTLAALALAITLASCAKPVTEPGVSLELPEVNDPSIAHPELFLVSRMDSQPSDSIKGLPTAVALHGYSATTFEWWEYRDYLDSVGGVRISLPLLGGHGRNYADFRKATWRDWQAGGLAEYKALADKGFTNLSLVCSSTGCPLLVEAFASGWFNGLPAPKEVVMIDPIIAPASKLLTLASLVGPMLGNVETSCSEAEKSHWFCNRPEESLQQLMDLLTQVRGQLEDGVQAPAGCKVRIYKSKADGSADPVSALMLYKGLRDGNGNKVDLRFVESRLHVFTRLQARETAPTSADVALQRKTFQEMTGYLKSGN